MFLGLLELSFNFIKLIGNKAAIFNCYLNKQFFFDANFDKKKSYSDYF